MASASTVPVVEPLTWRPTKIMNMRDLSKDDDFLSHLFVEKLGTVTVPLYVHKMDSSRRLPKTSVSDLMNVVRRLVNTKGPVQHTVRQAVDDLLKLPPIRYYLKSYTQKQINAFSTHASRYLELYHPSGSIEIAHTSRYSHRTGKSELCILATRYLPTGTVITELKGSMANLTEEEDLELKRTDLQNSDMRKDFSVIHSKQMKKNHLFLGPARFVNHDCDNNCELFREGKYITFRTLRAVGMGEEITAHYGDSYFGRRNRDCLCETCEKNSRGGYALDNSNGLEAYDSSDSFSDSDSEADNNDVNVNERRTRRGVYAVLENITESEEESDVNGDDAIPLADANDIPLDEEVDMTAEGDGESVEPCLITSTHPDTLPLVDLAACRAPAATTVLPTHLHSSLTPTSSADDISTSIRSHCSTPSVYEGSRLHHEADEGHAGPSNVQFAVHSVLTSDGSNTILANGKGSKFWTSSSASQNSSKGREKVVSNTPGSTPRSKTKRLSILPDDKVVKKEETEARALRSRTSPSNISETVAKERLTTQVLSDVDRKPLPTCITCANVLPVLIVDSQIVWGYDFEKSKKRIKQECPRCMRHFAIYGLPWPTRISPYGITTPREEMPPSESSTIRNTQKALPILDRKLVAAASASAPVHKKGKLNALKEQGKDKQKHSSKLSRKQQKRENTLTPSAEKLRSAKSRHNSLTSVSAPTQGPIDEPPVKRKRGRPRLSSPRRSTVKVKIEEVPSSSQPRDTSGRWQRGRTTETTEGPDKNAERKIHAESGTRNDDGGQTLAALRTSPRGKKRGRDTVDDSRSSSSKRLTRTSINTHQDDMVQRVLPRPVSSFRGGWLFSNPNPLRFALHAWAGPVVLNEFSSEADNLKNHSEEDDGKESPLHTEVAVSESSSASHAPASTVVRLPITFKPSPFSFAKRRWVSLTSARGDNAPTSVNGLGDNPLVNGARDRASGKRDVKRDLFATNSGAWSKANGAGVSDGEVAAPTRLSPLSDECPSALSSDDESVAAIIKHFYPPRSVTPRLHAVTFTQPDSTPHLIHARWDSCSDISEM